MPDPFPEEEELLLDPLPDEEETLLDSFPDEEETQLDPLPEELDPLPVDPTQILTFARPLLMLITKMSMFETDKLFPAESLANKLDSAQC